MKTILFTFAYLLTAACGRMDVTDSEHTVRTEGETTHTIRIELGDCAAIEDETKRGECVNKMLDIVSMIAAAREGASK